MSENLENHDADSEAWAEEHEKFAEKIDNLKEALKTHEIKSDEKNGPNSIYHASLVVHFPAGRSSRQIELSTLDEIEAFLVLDLNAAKFFESYDGTYSLRDQIIECHIGSVFPSVATRNYSLFPFPGANEIYIEGVPDDGAVTIKRNNPNQLLRFLRFQGFGFINTTLEIKGIEFKNHTDAEKLLEKIFDGIAFQLERKTGMMLELAGAPIPSADDEPRQSEKEFRETLNKLQFPRFEYDKAPMSLFRLSKTLDSAPLLRYLSLYQVLEFYFPSYTKLEARNRLSGIVKDPTFDIDRDSDFNRLFNSVSSLMGSGRFGSSEKDQLLATLTSTIDLDDLVGFLSLEERKNALGKRSALSDKTIKPEKTDQVFQDVCNRVYDIRCKVVHTKMAEGQGHLTPNSKAIKKMLHDISLIEFLAAKVLIKASKPLTL